jgi:hypothetical protein
MFPSFRWRCVPRVYPGPLRGKRLLATVVGAVALAAVGCGGGGSKTAGSSRELSARGASFSVPGSWQVTRTPTTVAATPSEGSDELVSVSIFRLLRPYTPALWERVVPELDRAADELGRQLSASPASRRTVTVAGGRGRVYELSFRRRRHDVRERITFVLRDQREYELLCRWRADQAEPGACATLVETFRPAA